MGGFMLYLSCILNALKLTHALERKTDSAMTLYALVVNTKTNQP
jgi:hypothetical protein